MFRPKVKAALFFSLLFGTLLGVSQSAHAAEASSNEVQQSSSTSVVVESSSFVSGQAVPPADISIESTQSNQVSVGGQTVDVEASGKSESNSQENAAPKDDTHS